MKKTTGFSPSTLGKALRDLSSGKTLDQYNLPTNVKTSIAVTRYSSQDISEAFAKVKKPKRVLSF
ncbi:hypothetical protein NH8B_0966 [Pseudogulbenkiania sp. NH8B]|uniref:hypothetical protein n=1 Tax=Pseudogulbenkiania sp. (strain NH8B) TaxID=748280 RepID=UPI0002279A84|nr:hypothetical protein [Pseudogulbenkiania sp. NH8B]BAK75798.1 hypothetical protein NH8B_0966 [Pseudogulbenkiania sp. NH8B]